MSKNHFSNNTLTDIVPQDVQQKRGLLSWPFTAIIVVLLFSSCGKAHSIATVPTEADANEMIHALYEGRVVARKELTEESSSGGARSWQVFVDEGPFEEDLLAQSLQVLHEHGLPRPEDKGLEKAYEEGGMFPSESAQQAQRLKELKTEVERQLRHLPSVVRVSANIVMPEDSGINIDPYPATASVLVVHKDEKPSFSADYVKELVAKGVPKLRTEEVSVVLVYEPLKNTSFNSQAPAPGLTNKRSSNNSGALWAGLAGMLAVCVALSAVILLQWRRQRHETASTGSEEASKEVGPRRVRAQLASVDIAGESGQATPRTTVNEQVA